MFSQKRKITQKKKEISLTLNCTVKCDYASLMIKTHTMNMYNNYANEVYSISQMPWQYCRS